MTNIGHNGWARVNLSNANYQVPLKLEITKQSINTELTFRQAIDYTANLISEKYNNLLLCFSGGLDSEYVAKILLENNIKFTPIIVVTPMNREESWYAQYFCDQNNLKPILLDCTTDDAYNKLLKDVLVKSVKLDVMPVVGLVPNVIADRYPEYHVLHGFGEPRGTTTPFYNVDYRESMNSTIEINDHHFFLDLEFRDKHPGPFFSYTPELFYTFTRELDFSVNTQICKLQLYNILPRPKFFRSLFSGDSIGHDVKKIFDNRMKIFKDMPMNRFAQNIERSELLNAF